jgi:2-polyprenyl-3-methyl-5-hydroxy-6-metoxy-1,4-benzoquinol methylase
MAVKGKTVKLNDGIPTMDEYHHLVNSGLFKEVEKYSDKFLSKFGQSITSYNKKWVKDPLHQWSRQWEYIYIVQNIEKHAKKKKKIKVLDLGSGITFLPYYLKDKLDIHSIKALDYDEMLHELYGAVNDAWAKPVDFLHKDMRDLGSMASKEFDHIYSVSVLEHTDRYESIIKDCHRLLKPGGKFSLTFDISLDSIDDIPVKEAKKLLNSLKRTFGDKRHASHFLQDLEKEIVVSHKIAKINKELTPWKYPQINIFKPLLQNKGFGTPYKKLTFCCLTLTKAA